MSRTFHIILGTLIVVVHSYVLAHLSELFPVLKPYPDVMTTGDEAGGQAIFKLMPFIAAGLFLFANTLTKRLSPRSKFTGEPLIGDGLWYLLGYGALLVSLGLYALFASV